MSAHTNPCYLVVDDDDVFRRRLAQAFRDRGLAVIEAESVNTARRALERTAVDSVVLDLKVGAESGLTLLRELHSRASKVRVVVLTGYGTIATAVEAVKLGAVNYLTKPADADAILGAFGVDEAIGTKPVSAPALAQVEWDHIQRVVQDCNGNISLASKLLGVHRRSLQRKLSKSPGKLR